MTCRGMVASADLLQGELYQDLPSEELEYLVTLL